jgi:hypothetical protein
MVELVMSLVRSKSDVVNALKMKSMLWGKDIELSGIVLGKKDDGTIPPSFLEDMIQLRIVGYMS